MTILQKGTNDACLCVGCLCCPPYHTFGELAVTFRLDSLVSDKTWAGQPCVWSKLGWTALCIAIPCWAYGAGQPCAWWICDSLGGCMHNAQGKCSQKVPPYAWIWAGIAKEREKLVLAWMKWMAGNQNTPLCGCFSCRSSAWGSCQLQMSTSFGQCSMLVWQQCHWFAGAGSPGGSWK